LEDDKKPEDEIKELKEEVLKLTKVIEKFKKMYNNWYKFKQQLGISND
tara:strand:- start:112 stop:255 length:144 start_codon:yes stop_codon:yes gene_type:complete